MNIVVHTQFCENYNPNGPDMFWKFKGGDAYLIKDALSPATAWAYVAINHGFKSDMGIEVPTSWEFFNGTDEDFRNDYEFGIIDTGLAEAHRDPSPPVESDLDAAPSAEGNVRGVSRAVGQIDGISLDRIWLASGRIPFDDEDTTIFLEANSEAEACDRFEACLYEDEAEGVMEMNARENGASLYLNVLVCLADAIPQLKEPS